RGWVIIPALSRSRGCSVTAIASPCHGEDWGFESLHPLPLYPWALHPHRADRKLLSWLRPTLMPRCHSAGLAPHCEDMRQRVSSPVVLTSEGALPRGRL